jgi:hypothetical protein
MFLNSPALLLLLLCVGCKSQTVEYRQRPSWHTALSGRLPNEHRREDGTIMKFSTSNDTTSVAVQDYLETITLEEKDIITGELTLRAILPEHVLKHSLTCLRDRNWKVLYEQLISAKTQQFYEQQENGFAKFESYFNANRREIAKTLLRIHGGISSGDVVVSERGSEIIHSLVPRVARDYEYRSVSFIREGQYLKLHSIQ